MWVQSPVEAVAEIAERHAIRPEDVEEIIIDPPVGDRMWVSETGFQSITHAEFSVPYVVSAYLHHPAPGAAWYSPETLSNPGVIALMQRVKPGPSAPETPEKGFARFRQGDYPVETVTLRTKDGQTYTASSGKHPGHPHNMYTEAQLRARFLVQAAPVLSEPEAERAFETLLNAEALSDAAALSAVLAGEN